MRKTKIICTLGPATDDETVLKQLMKTGMNVARINCSHGTHDEQRRRINLFKELRQELDQPIGLMLDTKGPEVRLGTFQDGACTLNKGDMFTLTTKDLEGDQNKASISYKGLPEDIKVSDRILVDDGLIEMRVERVMGEDIHCLVRNGGTISNRKSVNIPDVKLNMPYVSDKDRKDILFGIEHNVDLIAASFCTSAFDVMEIKHILEKNGGRHIQIIAKIENREGVENIDEILRVSDGVMIARGDMGVEIPFDELPQIQKELIKKCYRHGKKVITATQMLDSMINNPRPTRAEATDVANAVYDGTSAVMLSGETAIGKYPVACLETMSRIIENTEKDINYVRRFNQLEMDECYNVTNAISHATCTTAHDLGAAAIITVTKSGYTARMISSFRPDCPIISCTVSKKTYYQLALSWGVLPVMSKVQGNTDDLFEHAVECALETSMVKNGDLVAITAGVPLGVSGTTNILKVHIVGRVLLKGSGVGEKAVSSKLCVAKNEDEASQTFQDGDVLVIPTTSNDLLPLLRRASGIIVEEEGVTNHAAIVGLTLEIPVICGAYNATELLKSGTTVTVDAKHGLIYSGVTKGI